MSLDWSRERAADAPELFVAVLADASTPFRLVLEVAFTAEPSPDAAASRGAAT